MNIYRLHRRQRAAADYAGTLVIAQLWNPAGIGMLYCASSVSLAVLEILVHTDKATIPDDYVWSRASVDSFQSLNVNTEYIHDVSYTRNVGMRWARAGLEPGVMVPSVVVPSEMNILLNPLHDYYSDIFWQDPVSFAFDPRFFG